MAATANRPSVFQVLDDWEATVSAQRDAADAWEAVRCATERAQRLQAQADLRMGSFLMEIDVALMGGDDGR